MISKKNILATIIILIIMAFIRARGIDDIPEPILFAILLVIILYLFIFVFRYKGDKKERVYLLVMTIQAAILVIVLIVAATVQNKYPDISYRYKPVFVALMAILFLSLIVTVYSLGFYKYKNNKFKNK
jgi:predicted permease